MGLAPPLAILQARMGSTRLANKMLLELGGQTLIERAFRASVAAFGRENVVAAIPDNDAQRPLVHELERLHCRIFAWQGDENDVLSRVWHAAHSLRWHPASVLLRVTADDGFKSPELMKRVAKGERLPVEQGGEAFTLAMLDEAQDREPYGANPNREHITYALFPTLPPKPPTGSVWTIDDQQDLEAARAQLRSRHAFSPWASERCAL